MWLPLAVKLITTIQTTAGTTTYSRQVFFQQGEIMALQTGWGCIHVDLLTAKIGGYYRWTSEVLKKLNLTDESKTAEVIAGQLWEIQSAYFNKGIEYEELINSTLQRLDNLSQKKNQERRKRTTTATGQPSLSPTLLWSHRLPESALSIYPVLQGAEFQALEMDKLLEKTNEENRNTTKQAIAEDVRKLWANFTEEIKVYIDGINDLHRGRLHHLLLDSKTAWEKHSVHSGIMSPNVIGTASGATSWIFMTAISAYTRSQQESPTSQTWLQKYGYQYRTMPVFPSWRYMPTPWTGGQVFLHSRPENKILAVRVGQTQAWEMTEQRLEKCRKERNGRRWCTGVQTIKTSGGGSCLMGPLDRENKRSCPTLPGHGGNSNRSGLAGGKQHILLHNQGADENNHSMPHRLIHIHGEHRGPGEAQRIMLRSDDGRLCHHRQFRLSQQGGGAAPTE